MTLTLTKFMNVFYLFFLVLNEGKMTDKIATWTLVIAILKVTSTSILCHYFCQMLNVRSFPPNVNSLPLVEKPTLLKGTFSSHSTLALTCLCNAVANTYCVGEKSELPSVSIFQRHESTRSRPKHLKTWINFFHITLRTNKLKSKSSLKCKTVKQSKVLNYFT